MYVCKDETNNALLHERPRQNSSRLFTCAMRNRCGALGPRAVEDYLICEQQDTHVEKSCFLGPGFLPDQHHCQQILLSHCSKTLDCPTAVESKGRDKGRTSPRTARHLQNPPAQTGENETSRCAGPAHPKKNVNGLRTINGAPQTRCNGKPRQHKDVKRSVNSCSLSLCRRNTKLPHTLA